MTYKDVLHLKRQDLTVGKKAGMLDFMSWLGIGLFVAVFFFTAKPNIGVLQYAHLSDKGLSVKDFNGQERKAYMDGDDIYVDGQLVGRRISPDQIPNE